MFSRDRVVNKSLNKALDKCLLSHYYLIIEEHVVYKKENLQFNVYNFSYSESPSLSTMSQKERQTK